jgi:hypothetical protein
MSENEQNPEGISEAIIQQQVTTIINSDETQKLIRQKVCSEVKKGLEENKSIITEKVVKIIEDIKIDEALKGKVLEQLNSLIINLSNAPKDVINAIKEAQNILLGSYNAVEKEKQQKSIGGGGKRRSTKKKRFR